MRMPAEWAPHDGCLMAWPTRRELWGEVLETVRAEYAAAARAVARFEPVTMVAPPGQGEQARRRCGDGVEVVELPIDDSWLRDSGPIFVLGPDGSRAGVDFRFNTWGGKHHPCTDDDRISALLLERLNVTRVESGMILEGGAITVDGEGTLLTTEQCLLHPNRNPGLTRADIEAELKDRLGVTKVTWLPYGGLEDLETDATWTASPPSPPPPRRSSTCPTTPPTPTTPACAPTRRSWSPPPAPPAGPSSSSSCRRARSPRWPAPACQAMLPGIDVPELLLGVHSWTGFLDAFVHLADISTRMHDLPRSLAALLISEACNVGLTPVIKDGDEALTRGRLSHVDQNHVRAETHAAANAILIKAQRSVPIVRLWGGGLLASADGLRFVVPVQTISAAPSPKYSGYKRGLTLLNAVNDQVTGIG